MESSGDPLFVERFAPFDAARGEVLVACQRHFDAFPPDRTFDVRAFGEQTSSSLARDVVPHPPFRDRGRPRTSRCEEVVGSRSP